MEKTERLSALSVLISHAPFFFKGLSFRRIVPCGHRAGRGGQHAASATKKGERETFSFVAISNLKLKNAELHTEASHGNEEAADTQNWQSLHSAAHQYPKETRHGKIMVNFPLTLASLQRIDTLVSPSDESSAAADDDGSMCCNSSR